MAPRRLARFALLALLAGCASPAPFAPSQYGIMPATPPLVLAFAPGFDAPAPADTAQLRYLGAVLPSWVVPQLIIEGPRTLARARVVRDVIGRPVAVFRPPPSDRATGPDVAVLFLPSPPGIVADHCLGPGQPIGGTLWPGDDARRPRLLPAGCAVAAAMQAQVAAAGGSGDLLQGRPLPPGAASPFADAIEAYYRRNDPNQRASPAASSKSGNQGTSDAGAPMPGTTVQTGAPAPVPAQANPLLGPLPVAPAP